MAHISKFTSIKIKERRTFYVSSTVLSVYHQNQGVANIQSLLSPKARSGEHSTCKFTFTNIKEWRTFHVYFHQNQGVENILSLLSQKSMSREHAKITFTKSRSEEHAKFTFTKFKEWRTF